MEYIIYVRKSTDESSGQQTQSIPDQIKKCVDYAKMNDLPIMAKPKDFEFETEADIEKENNESDVTNVDIFQKTRGLYIVKEQQSAKTPWLRSKRNKLISMIKKGKIKGLLSYSPDRQCRNMLEGGELIDCVDNGLVDLKYTNFHFENTASGKMMLGIWFVFSKQYSDKLSEDITRGKTSAVERGKSQGKYKYGYYRDEDTGLYKPHPEYFPLMKEAFQMKLYMWASDEYIAQWLNSQWFIREGKLSSKSVNPKMLFRVWVDEFYYGIYIYGNSVVDMREVNPAYVPMITEDEHVILLNNYKKKSKITLLSTKKDKYADVRPLPKGLFTCPAGYAFVPYISMPSRLQAKLQKLRKTKPKAQLQDVIEPHQIRYRMANKLSKYYGLEFTFDKLDEAVYDLFKKIDISEDEYHEMVEVMADKLDSINQEHKEEYNRKLLQLNRTKAAKKEFIKTNLWHKRTGDEEKVYQSEIKRMDMDISFIEKELMAVTESERNTMIEVQVFLDVLRKAASTYKKASYVRKRSIIDLFVSNISVDKQKRLTLAVKPDLKHLFSDDFSSGGDDGNWTHV